MNEQLTLKELSAYLPYDIKVSYFDAERELIQFCKIMGFNGDELTISDGEYEYVVGFDDIKLCLLPLSHLTKEIEHKGERFVPIDFIQDKYYTQNWSDQLIRCIEDNRWVFHLDYSLILQLHEWHFDTFGLLDLCLAVDKTTIK
jgi:hypothetical protein